MAKKEPNKLDDMKTVSANETQAEEKAAPGNEPLETGSEAPAPELTAEEAAALAHEGEAALRDIGEEQLEPPTPFDIPASGDVVVSFDKINELANERKAAGLEAAQTPVPETKTQEVPAEKEAPTPEGKAPEKRRRVRAGSQRLKRPISRIMSRNPKKRPKPRNRNSLPKAPQRNRPRSKRKPRLQSRYSRRSRGRPRAPMNRNRLYISIFPSFTLSKTIRFKSKKMMKCGQWWRASRTRA